MAIVFDAPVSPVDQTVFVRTVPIQAGLTFSNEFPMVLKQSTRVNFSEITKVNRTARFRAPDGAIHVADRDNATDKSVQMLPLSDSRNRGEYERLLIEMARLGGSNVEAKVNAIYDDSTDLTGYMRNRVELAIADVMFDGKFTPAEIPGMELDYGVPAGNLTTAGTLWSVTATADPIANLIALADAYEALNGSRPGRIYTSRSVVRAFNTSTKVINAVRGAQTGVTRVSLPDAFGIFDSEGLPTEWRIVEGRLDVDGVETRIWPDGYIAFGPDNPADLLEFQFGISATALELVNSSEVDMSFADAPGIVGVVEKIGPPYREFTFVDAIGLPVLKDARKLAVFKAL